MDEKYTHKLEKIETELKRWLPDKPDASWLTNIFPGINGEIDALLIQSLTSPCKDLILRGGKRWRPLLMTLVCEILGAGDAALPLIPLVEFSHNASLIHDDIEDNSVMRRGKPAIHIIYGADTAINSGSFLYFLSLACIDAWAQTEANKAKVYLLWSNYLRKLHLGQAMDIYWHNNFDHIPSIDDYYVMCKLKTGCLARFAAELGALTAEIKGNVDIPTRHFGEAAEKLGLGFQILDDVKNLTTGIPGKKRGDDIVEGKKSLPLLMFLQGYPEKKDMVKNCFAAAKIKGIDTPEVEELIQEMFSCGILANAEEKGRALLSESRYSFLSDSFSGNESSNLLVGLIDFMR